MPPRGGQRVSKSGMQRLHSLCSLPQVGFPVNLLYLETDGRISGGDLVHFMRDQGMAISTGDDIPCPNMLYVLYNTNMTFL